MLQAGDPRLEGAATAASEAVRRYCRWHVSPMIEETLLLDGSGGRFLQLPSMHVVDVSEVKINGTTLGLDHYRWSQAGLLQLRRGHRRVFPAEFRSVEVTLTHGYHEAPDLVAVASQVARFALASPMGRTREQAGQIAVSWGTSVGMDWSDSAREMMKPYRLQSQP